MSTECYYYNIYFGFSKPLVCGSFVFVLSMFLFNWRNNQRDASVYFVMVTSEMDFYLLFCFVFFFNTWQQTCFCFDCFYRVWIEIPCPYGAIKCYQCGIECVIMLNRVCLVCVIFKHVIMHQLPVHLFKNLIYKRNKSCSCNLIISGGKTDGIVLPSVPYMPFIISGSTVCMTGDQAMAFCCNIFSSQFRKGQCFIMMVT